MPVEARRVSSGDLAESKSARRLDRHVVNQSHLPDGINECVSSAVGSADAYHRAVNDLLQFSGVAGTAIVDESALGALGGKPRGIAIKLLRPVQPHYLAQMGMNGDLWVARALAPRVARERGFLDAAVNPSLFEGLKGRGLGMGQTRLGASLGKNPAPAAGVDQ